MSQRHLRPVGRRLLLRPIGEEGTDGLIHVPEAFKHDKILRCRVIGIGGKCEEFAGKVGDEVLIDNFSGNTISGSSDLIVHEKNILGYYASKD